MERLLHLGLSNALVATVLALLAYLLGRRSRWPALAHGLWLLVLLKLLTPPLIPVPVPLAASQAVVVAPTPSETPRPTPDSRDEEVVIRLLTLPQDGPQSLDQSAPAETPAARPPANEIAPVPPALAGVVPAGSAPLPWTEVVLGVWLLGSVLWFLVLCRRVWAFQRLLRFAVPGSPALSAEVAGLAARLGLRRAPGVWLVPGRVSPMLWALFGRPRLLLPGELLASLDARQRATLILHELAHLARRDHWVRLLEALVSGLYWWHPVVWWARRQLREAEEVCCDAWVLWAEPGAGRDYAAALMECLDFLSEEPAPLPVGASGVGKIDDLKRRLTMIMQPRVPRKLTRTGILALAVLGLTLLPLWPCWAQTATGGSEEQQPSRKEQPRVKEPTRASDADLKKVQEEMDKLKKELAEQLARVRDTEAKLREAAEKLARMKVGAAGAGEKKQIRVIIIEDGKVREGTLDDLKLPLPVPTVPKPVVIPRIVQPPLVQPQPDRRMKELEERLERMARELEELRKQLRGRSSESKQRFGPPALSPTGDPAFQFEVRPVWKLGR